MISSDGWVDWAIHAPGIPDKIYTQKNSGIGLVGHSIVGSYLAALSRFMSEAKEAGAYTPNAAASVMFILCKNGDLIQMYDVWSSTWTSGGRLANTSYWAIEAEGGPPSNPTEDFTPAQRVTLLRLFDEFRDFTGRTVVRGTTFREHGELAAELGYLSTTCPSHRYDWFTAQEDNMTPQEREEHQALVAIMGGRDKLLANQAGGMDFILGYTLEQQKLADHIANHAAGVSGPVAEHTHVEGKVKR